MDRKRARLAAFDLDGTLVRGETICEVLARPLGRFERMRELESLPITNQSADISGREEMASWYEGISEDKLCYCLANAKLAPGASAGIQLLRQAGIKTAIVSVTWDFAAKWFAKRLGMDYFVGTKLLPDGRIEHFWPKDKPIWLAEVAKSLGFDLKNIAAVGDSGGDVPMLRAVGAPFFVGTTLPGELQDVIHVPQADIQQVVDLILNV